VRDYKPKILVAEAEGFPTQAAMILRELGQVCFADLDRQALVGAVREVEILWIRLRNRIDTEILDAAPHLKVIVTPTTGLNHIDLEAAYSRGVAVLSLRGEVEFLRDVRATAEHTLALILLLLRHIPAAMTHVCNGGWNRDLFKGHELYGKTVGIIGYGRLGQIVGRYLQALDMRVLVTDPHVDANGVQPGLQLVSLTQLLQEADIVTLHVNLIDETHHLFGRQQFAQMKPGAYFINTARGELVDEVALVDALQSGRVGGAAVDVLCGENSTGMANHALVKYACTHQNVVITPHIGGCTFESLEKSENFLTHKLCQYLQTEC
jgi:D-3-phosphoglycerate dehydrogenase